ncbi:MAG: tandem-95 repeat protein [Caldilineaceae bacterium]|nr:tandem-95 repeat protein [Caldilineaceae bacterium]
MRIKPYIVVALLLCLSFAVLFHLGRAVYAQSPDESSATFYSYLPFSGTGTPQIDLGLLDETVITDEETPVVVTLSAAKPDATILEFAIAQPPLHGSLGSISGAICAAGTPSICTATVIYIPSVDFAGNDSFSYRGSSVPGNAPNAAAGEGIISITVNPINDAPRFTKGADVTVESTAGAQSIPAWATQISAGPADEAGQSLTFVVSNSDNSLFAVQPSISSAGTLAFTPVPTAGGTAIVTVRLQDDGGTAKGGSDESAAQTFTITIEPPAGEPVGSNQEVNVHEGGQVTIALSATNPSGMALTFVIANPPSHGTLGPIGPVTCAGAAPNSCRAEITYSHDGSESTSDLFTYQAGNGVVESGLITVSITVTPVDDAPIAVDDEATVNEDAAATLIDVLANDTDVDGGPMSIAAVGNPANGTVLIAGDNRSLTYQPDPDYCNDSVLSRDTFTYTLAPGGDEATVAVTVTCVNDAPVADHDSYSLLEGATLTIVAPGVLANDTDIENDPLTAVIVAGPAHAASFTLDAEGGFTYVHDGSETAADQFTYRANDGLVESNVATVSLTITPTDDAPLAVNDAITVVEDSGATTIDVLGNDTDTDGGPMSIATVGDPANGSVVMAGDNLSVSYAPDLNYCNDLLSVTDNFTYTLAPGGSEATVSVTVICVNDAPVAMDDSITVTEDLPFTGSVLIDNGNGADSDPDGDPLTIATTPVVAPTHGSLILRVDGTFTYTPTLDYVGDDFFTYRLLDGSALSDTAQVTLTVLAVNDAPLAVNRSASVMEGGSITVTLSATDNEGDALTFAIDTPPTHGALGAIGSASCDDNTPSTCTAEVAYTHDGSETTSDSFTYTANDGAADSPVASVSVTITPTDDAPLAVDDVAVVDEDSGATTIDVLANDTDVDGGPKSITSAGDPANGTVVVAGDNLSLTYKPDLNYCNSEAGTTDTFTYAINGGSTATVAVTVNCINDDPVAEDDLFTTAEDTELADGNVLDDNGNGADFDIEGDTLTVNTTPITDTLHGALVLNTDGSFVYSPTLNFAGTDSFGYELSDGNGGIDTAVVTITVTPVDDAPVAVNDAATVSEDAAATTIDVLANDTDVDGGPKTIVAAGDPANGTVLIAGDNLSLTYQPNANYCNTLVGSSDTFTYTLNGGSTATVAMTVTCVNDAPSADDDSYSVNEGATLNVAAPGVLEGDTDVDNDTLAVNTTPVSGPMNATSFTLSADGSFVYTHNGSETTSDSFVYQVCDDAAIPACDTATVNLTIIPVNDAPVNSVPGAQTVNEDTDLIFPGSIAIDDVDAGTSAVQVTLSALNGLLTLNGTSGLTFSSGDGIDDATMTFTGMVATINSRLDGLTYRGNSNFNETRGSETLTITTNDLGNSGLGGPLSDTDSVGITVVAVGDKPIATAKNYSAQANMQIAIPAGNGLLQGVTDPDTGDSGYSPTFTVGTVGGAAPSGGTIIHTIANVGTVNVSVSTGEFSFDPAPGVTGSVVFTYTVCDNGSPDSSCSDPSNVTFNVGGPVIWFVNPAVAGPGDGRLSNPFKFLSGNPGANNDVDDVDGANHRIFLYSGTATSGIPLNSGEWLIGQGSSGTSFDTFFGIIPPAGTIARPTLNGTRPVVQGQVTLGTNGVVQGLDITPLSGVRGLSASGATGLSVSQVSVTTNNAIAVNLVNSDGTFNFTRINANGGTNGIVWTNNSLATGSFTVAGSGGTCTDANTSGCSGGTIQNSTGADDSSVTPVGTGIVLNNAHDVSLTRMWIHDHSNYGIRGTSVDGFTLDNSVVNGSNGTNVATPYNDGSLVFFGVTGASAGMTGNSSITNSTIRGGWQRNIAIDNSTGTLNLTVSNNTIRNTSPTFGDDGLFIEADTTANITAIVTNNTFAAHGGDHFNLSLLNNAVVDLTFTGNALSGGHATGLGQGIFILGGAFNGSLTYDISNNGTDAVPFSGSNQGGAINVNKGSGSGIFSGRIENNVIGDPDVDHSGSLQAFGIIVGARGAGSHTTLINNNKVSQFHDTGIVLEAGEGSAALNATVTNNSVSDFADAINSLHGIYSVSGILAGDSNSVCLDIHSNSVADAGNEAQGGADIRVRKGTQTSLGVRLPSLMGSSSMDAMNLITGNNPTATTVTVTGAGYTGGAACAQP